LYEIPILSANTDDNEAIRILILSCPFIIHFCLLFAYGILFYLEIFLFNFFMRENNFHFSEVNFSVVLHAINPNFFNQKSIVYCPHVISSHSQLSFIIKLCFLLITAYFNFP